VGTTTIRVDSETHTRLVQLSREAGWSLVDTVREATEALRRQRFAQQVRVELGRLAADEQSWAAYLAEGDSTSVSDGLG